MSVLGRGLHVPAAGRYIDWIVICFTVCSDHTYGLRLFGFGMVGLGLVSQVTSKEKISDHLRLQSHLVGRRIQQRPVDTVLPTCTPSSGQSQTSDSDPRYPPPLLRL